MPEIEQNIIDEAEVTAFIEEEVTLESLRAQLKSERDVEIKKEIPVKEIKLDLEQEKPSKDNTEGLNISPQDDEFVSRSESIVDGRRESVNSASEFIQGTRSRKASLKVKFKDEEFFLKRYQSQFESPVTSHPDSSFQKDIKENYEMIEGNPELEIENSQEKFDNSLPARQKSLLAIKNSTSHDDLIKTNGQDTFMAVKTNTEYIKFDIPENISKGGKFYLFSQAAYLAPHPFDAQKDKCKFYYGHIGRKEPTVFKENMKKIKRPGYNFLKAKKEHQIGPLHVSSDASFSMNPNPCDIKPTVSPQLKRAPVLIDKNIDADHKRNVTGILDYLFDKYRKMQGNLFINHV